MCEVCFCGWFGDTEDKVLIHRLDRSTALACPRCGRVDDLSWNPPANREALLNAVRERRILRVIDEGVAG